MAQEFELDYDKVRFISTNKSFPMFDNKVLALKNGTFLVASYDTLQIIENGNLKYYLMDNKIEPNDQDDDEYEYDYMEEFNDGNHIKRNVLELQDGNIATTVNGIVHVYTPTLEHLFQLEPNPKIDHFWGIETMIQLNDGRLVTHSWDGWVRIWNLIDKSSVILPWNATRVYDYKDNQFECHAKPYNWKNVDPDEHDQKNGSALFQHEHYVISFFGGCQFIWNLNTLELQVIQLPRSLISFDVELINIAKNFLNNTEGYKSKLRKRKCVPK
jgi:hypothetical protein